MKPSILFALIFASGLNIGIAQAGETNDAVKFLCASKATDLPGNLSKKEKDNATLTRNLFRLLVISPAEAASKYENSTDMTEIVLLPELCLSIQDEEFNKEVDNIGGCLDDSGNKISFAGALKVCKKMKPVRIF